MSGASEDVNLHHQAAPRMAQHAVDIGNLLQIAYEDEEMTVEEDLTLGPRQSALRKRSYTTGYSGNDDSESEPEAIRPPLPPTHSSNGATPRIDTASTPIVAPSESQSAKNRKRAEKRRKAAVETLPADRVASDWTRREHTQLSEPISVASAFTTCDMPAMNGAYKARNEDNDPEAKKKFRDLSDFLECHPDFEVVPWNGIDPIPILDSNGKIAATLCGQPGDEGYREAADEAFKAMLEATESTRFRKKEKHHRRGGFPAVNIGVTYGIGHDEPKFLKTDCYTDMLWRILENKHVQRLASYGSSAFQLWQPNVYRYYAERLEKLWSHRPDLKRIFGKRSVYPCAAFNFAHNVWCYKHRDVMNCPFGFCAITALGNFDPTKGGHLILWEFKMVIEFPHGSTILVPSATITHSNIPVQKGDVRLSFTQFCAGGLFQYIDNGFSTEVDIQVKDSARDTAEYVKTQRRKPLHWEAGLSLISTMDDVKFT